MVSSFSPARKEHMVANQPLTDLQDAPVYALQDLVLTTLAEAGYEVVIVSDGTYGVRMPDGTGVSMVIQRTQ